MMIFVSMPDSLLFDIYCVCGELSRAVSPPRRRALGRVLTVESSSVRLSETLLFVCFVFQMPQTNTNTTGFGLLKLRS